jgi:hypothetical protein
MIAEDTAIKVFGEKIRKGREGGTKKLEQV